LPQTKTVYRRNITLFLFRVIFKNRGWISAMHRQPHVNVFVKLRQMKVLKPLTQIQTYCLINTLLSILCEF